ncbi:CUN080 hypothetical protein [Culex nigripalpus nucleopolyhedrovirus]|uniref:Uncharacterized protein n=1 Tax=Culex nigripalpus nucleopolyhedrovirus (isolate Florida/1997) TaxID=645993 RepID=Q919J6_NPVCO|nr:CUN080 hypothetical protein [Culex nigripalpus nucleopolyhedrovirus]AAK94158.1 CUN080 hypothetical protein [Culex nigripalpus nucleopolyhedrovirus]
MYLEELDAITVLPHIFTAPLRLFRTPDEVLFVLQSELHVFKAHFSSLQPGSFVNLYDIQFVGKMLHNVSLHDTLVCTLGLKALVRQHFGTYSNSMVPALIEAERYTAELVRVPFELNSGRVIHIRMSTGGWLCYEDLREKLKNSNLVLTSNGPVGPDMVTMVRDIPEPMSEELRLVVRRAESNFLFAKWLRQRTIEAPPLQLVTIGGMTGVRTIGPNQFYVRASTLASMFPGANVAVYPKVRVGAWFDAINVRVLLQERRFVHLAKDCKTKFGPSRVLRSMVPLEVRYIMMGNKLWVCDCDLPVQEGPEVPRIRLDQLYPIGAELYECEMGLAMVEWANVSRGDSKLQEYLIQQGIYLRLA